MRLMQKIRAKGRWQQHIAQYNRHLEQAITYFFCLVLCGTYLSATKLYMTRIEYRIPSSSHLSIWYWLYGWWLSVLIHCVGISFTRFLGSIEYNKKPVSVYLFCLSFCSYIYINDRLTPSPWYHFLQRLLIKNQNNGKVDLIPLNCRYRTFQFLKKVL